MSWRASWDELWAFAQPTGKEFFEQLDRIMKESSPEFQKIILKNAPQEVKDKYSKIDYQHNLQDYKHIPSTQELYKSLGITEKQVEKFQMSKRATRSPWVERHLTFRLIQSFFGGFRIRPGK